MERSPLSAVIVCSGLQVQTAPVDLGCGCGRRGCEFLLEGQPRVHGAQLGSDGLQFLARLEAHGFARRDIDLLAGARVAADAGLAGLDGEDSESAGLGARGAAPWLLG